jgi:hypothetical protein
VPHHRILRTPRLSAIAAGLAAASLGLATLVAPLAADAGTSGTSSTSARTTSAVAHEQVARYGAGWLASQIHANGGHLEAFGFDDPSDTATAVVALHAAGVGRAASNQAIAYLETQLTDAVQTGDGSDDPGRLGYWVMAAVSAGKNPRQFGGRAPVNNLVKRLLATVRTTGPDVGLFGAADPTFDGAFRQGTALAALEAAHVPSSNKTVKAAIAWLEGQQCANGLWQAYRSDTTIPCPAADPDTFTGPDTNSTGMAVQGLAAYRKHPHAAAVLRGLKAVQSRDGGFPYLAAAGQDSDPNSTALVIQALLAERVSPTARRWRMSGATPYSALASYQLGCTDSATDRGAFFYPGDRSPNILATVQAVPTLRCGYSGASVPTAATAEAAKAAKALAGTAGHCPGTTGVTVAVDFKAFGSGLTVRCAPGTPATGVAALQQAGFALTGTAQYGLAFICRINSLPSPTADACKRTPPVSAYWAYYHANKGVKTWTTSAAGASSYKPAQGSIEGWAFGASAKPSKTPAQIRAGS